LGFAHGPAESLAEPGTVRQGRRRIRIVYILDFFFNAHGGTETQIVSLIRNLDRAGYEPFVYLLRDKTEIQGVLADVPVESIGIRKLGSVTTLFRLAWLCVRLRHRGIRLAHLYFNDTTVALPWLLRVAGIRVIISRRDMGFWHTPGLLRVLRLNRFAVAAVVANSSAVRDAVLVNERYPPGKIVVIPNGKAPVASTADPRATRRAIGLDATARIILVVANIRPIKRIADVISALALVRCHCPDANVVLAGADHAGLVGPSHKAELQALAKEFGVESHVFFLGAVEEPAAWVNAADICVLASESEGLSNSIIEYMLAEKPIVCTAVGGNPELISHDVTGALVEVGHPEQLAMEIIRYLRDPERARAVAKSAAQYARSRYSVAQMVTAHEALYHRVSA
jgi:glycosyltransferase involved in cell wall biosynthesis